MPVITSPEYLDLLLGVQRVRANFYRARNAVLAAQPLLDQRADARVTLFNKCHNITKAAELAIGFTAGYLLDPKWWDREHEPVSQEGLETIILEFSQFAKGGYFYSLFGAIESSCRIYLRAIAPEAANRGTAEFRSVYVTLLSTHLPGLSPWIPLLDLLRLTRNTVHNNGMVFTSKLEQEIEWKGVRYQFLAGKHVEFVTWEFIFERAFDLAEFSQAIVSHPVLAVAPLLRDPAAEPLAAA